MDAFAVEQLDFSELQAAMDEILNQSFSFQDTVLALLSGGAALYDGELSKDGP